MRFRKSGRLAHQTLCDVDTDETFPIFGEVVHDPTVFGGREVSGTPPPRQRGARLYVRDQ